MSPKTPWIRLKMGCGESLLGSIPSRPLAAAKPAKGKRPHKQRDCRGEPVRCE